MIDPKAKVIARKSRNPAISKLAQKAIPGSPVNSEAPWGGMEDQVLKSLIKMPGIQDRVRRIVRVSPTRRRLPPSPSGIRATVRNARGTTPRALVRPL